MSAYPPELSGAIEPAGDPRDGQPGSSGGPVSGQPGAASDPVGGPAPSDPVGGAAPSDLPRCGRWKLKPFELPRPVLLRPDGPLSLAEFLAAPDPAVLDAFSRLDLEQVQALVLARLRGAPPDMRLSLFGEPGYTLRDVVRHVEEGTPLGVRIIDAERKLVGLLLTEALREEA